MRIIRADGISKNFANEKLFHDLSFSAKRGESLIVQGRNGTGKTTLAKICAGLDFHTDGILEIDGQVSIASPSIRPFPELTGAENIEYACGRIGTDCEKTAAAIGLLAWMNKPCGHYSSGTLQKLGICIALSLRPDLLILDEPFAHLDDKSAEAVAGLIDERRGKMALILTQNNAAQKKYLRGKEINLENFRKTN